jgi:SET domain-containing protein
MKKIRRRFEPQNFKIRVGRSRTGLGVFAEEAIPRGACVLEYKGRALSDDEQHNKNGKYFFETGKNTMIDGNVPNNPAKYINHACKPNCEIDLKNKRVYIFAAKNIKAGEELNYDYDTEYFDEFIKPIGCKCPSCDPVKK